MEKFSFNVFGTIVAVTGTRRAWQAWYLGAEGKRRPADFIVPADLEADELQQYLGDLFHENATPKYGEVVLLTGTVGHPEDRLPSS